MFGEFHPSNVEVSESMGLDALLASHKEALQSEGLITAYQRDPERFRRFAALFDTVATAKHVGEVIQARQTALRFPFSSAELPLKDSEKLDPWNHPYCIHSSEGALFVVSGGPKASSFSCATQRVKDRQIASAIRKVFQTAEGEVVVVLLPVSEPHPSDSSRSNR